MKGTTQTRFATNPQVLEEVGAMGFLSAVNRGFDRITAMRLIDEDGNTVSAGQVHRGPLAVEFSHEEDTGRHFYHFHVVAGKNSDFFYKSSQIRSCFEDARVIASYEFTWILDDEHDAETKVLVLLFKQQHIGFSQIQIDTSRTYWSTICNNSTQLLYEGISTFIEALNDKRYIRGMKYRMEGEGLNQKISVGFLTSPSMDAPMQTLYFSVFYGEEHCIDSSFANQRGIMHRYDILDKIRIENYHCNPMYLVLYQLRNS